jgi:DNA-binding PadR family transcriptional regulator
MRRLWMSGTGHGKERGLLVMYVLHSLDREPKSGYDLLKEIAEKTGGAWVPSKGTLYPLLKELEGEELIRVCGTGKRSKQIFEPTEPGRYLLRSHRKHATESRHKMLLFRNLLLEILGEEKTPARELAFAIHRLVEGLPSEKEEQAAEILERCRSELQGIV